MKLHCNIVNCRTCPIDQQVAKIANAIDLAEKSVNRARAIVNGKEKHSEETLQLSQQRIESSASYIAWLYGELRERLEIQKAIAQRKEQEQALHLSDKAKQIIKGEK
jgi:hypothetical protein